VPQGRGRRGTVSSPGPNNLAEGLFHGLKRGERSRSGRKHIARDMEELPASVALASNLQRPDYVQVLCGTLDDLPRAFAELDAATRKIRYQVKPDATLEPKPTSSQEPATASLPREDRVIIRSEAMKERVLLAAGSRAPWLESRRPRSPGLPRATGS